MRSPPLPVSQSFGLSLSQYFYSFTSTLSSRFLVRRLSSCSALSFNTSLLELTVSKTVFIPSLFVIILFSSVISLYPLVLRNAFCLLISFSFPISTPWSPLCFPPPRQTFSAACVSSPLGSIILHISPSRHQTSPSRILHLFCHRDYALA